MSPRIHKHEAPTSAIALAITERRTKLGSSIPPPNDPDYGAWSLLYYGSTMTFDLRGPVFNTPGADGKMVPVSCVNNQKYQAAIPVP